jgi:hypothetical protein
MKQEAREAAGSAADKAKETASAIGEKARETAANVADKAKQIGSNVKDKADQGVTSAGSGMQSLADQIRDKGPHEGMLGRATSSVADTLDQSGRYLEEKGLSGIAGDITETIRRNPIPAVLIGVGLGYMLARMTTPRS